MDTASPQSEGAVEEIASNCCICMAFAGLGLLGSILLQHGRDSNP